MRNLDLGPRLKIIADSMRGFETAADIGSDHAYLPIYAVKNGLVKSAVATDVNSGPAEISRERIKSQGLESKVRVRQGNGLQAIKPGEAEVIVIAGMGGILIKDILDRGIRVAESAKLLILQPMRDSDKVRKWLLGHGFDIIDEELVKDQDKIYEVLWAKPVGKAIEVKGSMLIGDKIIEKKHPLAAEYINRKIGELIKVTEELEGKDTANSRERTEECKALLNYYREVAEWVR
ncbi:MAG: class I SAM-dependent methyltransferase [Clostridiaceae bacterium]|nr:class I SAM-dependent methyltransferase [Clostridiaceae bacterium]